MSALRAPTAAPETDPNQPNSAPAGTSTLEPVATPTPTPAKRTSRVRTLAVGCLWALVGLAGFVAFWALMAWQNPDLPGPLDAWDSLTELLSDGLSESSPYGRGILLQLFTSLGRTLKGFALAALVGIPLGLLIGGSRRAWQAANPIMQVLRPVSPLAWFPIGLVVLKNSPDAAVFVIFITALWPTLLNTADGAASVPADQRNVGRVFHFNRRTYVGQVMIPHSVPSIVTGLRLSMGIAWMVIVAAEMMSSAGGIGFFVWDSYNGGNIPAVMSAIILIGIVGVVLDSLFMALARHYTGEKAR